MGWIKGTKRWTVLTVGSLVTLTGLILMPVPGPGGTPVFIAGLAILATEAQWAKRFLERFKQAASGMSKRRRLAITYSALAFYLVSGVAFWSWTNQQKVKTVEISNA